MPPRSFSRGKSNKRTKKTKFSTSIAQPNNHSSPAVQSQGEVDPKILREQNGRCGNGSLRPNSVKCQCLVVEEEKKGFSVSAGHNEMEGTAVETEKVESQSEDKEVTDVHEEEVKSIVESSGEVAAETQEGEDSTIVIQSEEKSVPIDSEKEEERKEAFEPVIEAIKEPDVEESKQEEELLISEETEETLEEKELPPSEQPTEPSSALADESSRETEAVETTEAVEDKLASSENKDLSLVETNEGLKNTDSSVPPTEVVPKAIEETTIVKPDESEETKLPAEEVKVGEPTVVQESSKEEDVNKSAETPSSTVQEKTEIPRSTEIQTPGSAAQRQHNSWSSCCGLFELLFLGRDGR